MKHVFALLAFLLFVGVAAPSVYAQEETAQTQIAEGQEYKQAFNDARAALQEKKYQDAYDGFKAALDGAVAAEDADVEALARGILAKLDYTFGTAKVRKDDYAGAIVDYRAGTVNNPEFPNNYLGLGSALRKLDSTDVAMKVLGQAIVVATAAGDGSTKEQSETALLNLIAEDGGLLLGKNASRSAAQQAMERLASVDTLMASNPMAKLYLSRAHTALGSYNEAVAAADAGLALEPRDRNDKAALYFAKGEALRLAGNVAAAKSAYTLAVYGDYKDVAQHYVDTL